MSTPPPLQREAIGWLYREWFGRAVGVLARGVGDLDLAEEVVQDAFATAVERWPRDGLPDDPGAWIIRTARNRGIPSVLEIPTWHRDRGKLKRGPTGATRETPLPWRQRWKEDLLVQRDRFLV